MITSVSANSGQSKSNEAKSAQEEKALQDIKETKKVDKAEDTAAKEGADGDSQLKEPRFDRYEKGVGVMPEVAAPEPAALGEEPVSEQPPETKTTGNTDRVDAEIRQLRQEAQKLEQQISQASGDDELKQQLERSLADVKAQLLQKDNDSYRKQHTVFS